MCSAADDPTTYDAPAVSKPRAYVLSGTAKTEMEPQPSIALAVIGEMLEEAEERERSFISRPTNIHAARAVTQTLRTARQRIADAEAGL